MALFSYPKFDIYCDRLVLLMSEVNKNDFMRFTAHRLYEIRQNLVKMKKKIDFGWGNFGRNILLY